ncbi:MAG: hypothetical protein F4Z16_06550 [Rhodothermaceae bacterium]|nr:hypothetical protein [Rhodothermaceae bacterium]MYD66856.1 hypothetical protein [Rhodothermaceae bacterium]
MNGIPFPYESGDHRVKEFQNRMHEVSRAIRSAADTVAILETSWASHYSREDIEELRGHLQDVGREVDRVIGKAARALPRKQVRSTPIRSQGRER